MKLAGEWPQTGNAENRLPGLFLHLPAEVATALLRGYKKFISPMLPASCRYTPTCAEYAQEAVERYGVLRGGALAAWRLLRCQPLAKGGYDPVVRSDWSRARMDCGQHQRC